MYPLYSAFCFNLGILYLNFKNVCMHNADGKYMDLNFILLSTQKA